ncbi:hypothetical protein EK21DRAFT_18747, partial [Setomelanomma holmii]
MTGLPDNTLVWIDMVYKKPIHVAFETVTVISTFGPYTNSTYDQNLLRQRLYEMCDADPQHLISHNLVDNAMTPSLEQLHLLQANRADGERLFTVYVKDDDHGFCIKVDGSIEDMIRRRLDPEGLRLLPDDWVSTFCSKKEAMHYADTQLKEANPYEEVVIPL